MPKPLPCKSVRARYGWCALVLLLVASFPLSAQTTTGKLERLPPAESLARQYFGADAPWFEQNIPFLEIDDPDIQRVYYYRWKLYRAHIREIGVQGNDITEFLDNVPWARQPYTDLNDSSSFHIMEGRWLRDPAYVGSLIDHLYSGGGNDRHFSESIAAATLAWTEVTGDPAPALRHLDTMQHIYNLWDDHFDARRNLYWIEPIADATEYTISSIDASGAGFTDKPSTRDSENGFLGGYAFRPSINAYQFANARAIASLASLAGKPQLAADYNRRAENLRNTTLAQLWNPDFQHFTDIYQRSTPYVKAGNFIRGRELVGYVPWMYELPPTMPNAAGPAYAGAWKHALNTAELAGPFGLRTDEPTYARYMHQYRYDKATGLPECQWNGPSWPFQTSQTLTAMANLLHDYKQDVVTPDDYVHLLRQYTRQHALASGELDLQEDYDPDTGKPIVGLPRSHHYNHSTYNDLVLSGLLGIRPRLDDVLEIAPLLPNSSSGERPIRYFALENLRYHGHDIAVVYDQDGSRYKLGAGMSVFSDGLRIAGPSPLGMMKIQLGPGTLAPAKPKQVDVAANVWDRAPSRFEPDLPIASASPSSDDAHLYEAIDGRMWFFPEISNGWSPLAKPVGPYWYGVDLRSAKHVQSAQVFFSETGDFRPPASFRLQEFIDGSWIDVPEQKHEPAVPLGNGTNTVTFPATQAQRFRLVLTPADSGRVRLIEFKLSAAQP